MGNDRDQAVDALRFRVWAGYDDPDGVFASVIDDVWFEVEDPDERWLRAAIKREFQKKRKAEKDWPAITTCDVLDQVFEVLNGTGILARHRCGLTQQDGLEVINGLYLEQGGKDSKLRGYCFYQLQDMEGAMWGEGGLWLAYGGFSPNRVHTAAVGSMIQDEFEKVGIPVEWDGSPETRLFLKGFRWQRRSPDSD